MLWITNRIGDSPFSLHYCADTKRTHLTTMAIREQGWKTLPVPLFSFEQFWCLNGRESSTKYRCHWAHYGQSTMFSTEPFWLVRKSADDHLLLEDYERFHHAPCYDVTSATASPWHPLAVWNLIKCHTLVYCDKAGMNVKCMCSLDLAE